MIFLGVCGKEGQLRILMKNTNPWKRLIEKYDPIRDEKLWE